MSEDRPIYADGMKSYIIDTNILIDYGDIIPGKDGEQPHESLIDLSQAHLIIPTVVERELSKFKRENSARGGAAREALRRIDALSALSKVYTMDDAYNLRAPVKIPDTEQLFSILPVHKNFRKCLPFHPSDDDKDGQIILTALAASLALKGKKIDGGELPETIMDERFDNVVLLTNDKGLAARARVRGIKSERYGYKYPDPYTGRRDIVVPNELFAEYYNSPDHALSRVEFERMMPDEAPLVANEFIVMQLEDSFNPPRGFYPFDDAFFDAVGRYDKDLDAIVRLRYVRDFPIQAQNPGQAIYAEALMDPDIAAVICTGSAGSGKTYMATIFGYTACKSGRFIGVTAVPCENRSNLGALPGDLDEKMDPDVQPLKNALRNYLLHNDSGFKKQLEQIRQYGPEQANAKKGRGKKGGDNQNGDQNNGNGQNGCQNGQNGQNGSIKTKLENRVNLIWDNWFSSVPIEFARGRDFAYELAIYDEFQDQNAAQADTLIKRIGNEGKIVLTGDIKQIHAPYLDQDNNGLVYASRQLFDNPMVAQVHFTEDEIVRHPLVQEIARRQKATKPQSAQD